VIATSREVRGETMGVGRDGVHHNKTRKVLNTKEGETIELSPSKSAWVKITRQIARRINGSERVRE